MLGSTLLLTLATLAGLVAGFAREWLLVADWGAGSRTDAFLVAMFLPEAVRTMLAGGLLSAACLPLWRQRGGERHGRWLAGQLGCWLLLGAGLALALMIGKELVVGLIGPGLAAGDRQQAADALLWLALVLPGLLLHALLTVPAQARGHFLLPGLGSLLFNLPAVLYLWATGQAARPQTVAQCFVLGSLLMPLLLVPEAWRCGWRPWLRGEAGSMREVWRQLWPLLASSGASQGVAWLERMAASWLGEGSITLVNLARKLINIPLIALMSLNQVLLGKMSGEAADGRRETLERGLFLCTLLTVPAAAGLIAIAPALVALALPGGLAGSALPSLLSVFAMSIVFGSWNALLARFHYAHGDVRTPLACELRGSALQAVALLVLPWFAGIYGVALAAMVGVAVTVLLLGRYLEDRARRRLFRLGVLSLLLCAASALLQLALQGFTTLPQWGLATLWGLLAVALLACARRFLP